MEEANYTMDTINIILTVVFIILNGFFVAAEFAMVKLTKSKIKTMMREKQPFASTAMWLFKRQNMALSACQLGITMASLALGWIGEPAIAHVISPWILDLGVTSEKVLHGIAFAIAFTIITSLHIVIGEQVPKIYAIRRPGPVMLGTAFLLKVFYILLFPFMFVLNAVTNVFLRGLGITGSGEHDEPLTEEEIRASLTIAYATGELSKTEHKLLNAVFKFDDEVTRKVMVPRGEVEILNDHRSFEENVALARASNHSRFPLCEDSLDRLIGVVHIKDLMRSEKTILKDLARSPLLIPENVPLGKLLQEFKMAKQHLAFIQDEHGTILGIVTLEDVLEELVGSVWDEFDTEETDIVPKDNDTYIIAGDTTLDEINEVLDTNLYSEHSDTLSGLIVEEAGHKIEPGLKVSLEEDTVITILEVDGIRVKKAEIKVDRTPEKDQGIL